jgi:hypothetical protein
MLRRKPLGHVEEHARDQARFADAEQGEANLFDLQAKYADVVSEKEAIRYIAGLERAP